MSSPAGDSSGGSAGARPAVVVVVPVFRNAETLAPLADRLATALAGRAWRLRWVVDASPDDSARIATGLAARDPRQRVTALAVNVGQHRALARGLADEPDAEAWVCLDADLQDPPEAVPALLDQLSADHVEAVFAGRRGAYERRGRRWTGTLHRRAVSALTGLPPDAGAFVALGAAARDTVVTAVRDRDAPSVVVAIGAARLPVASLPVARAARTVGSSAWTGRARLVQSARILAWAARQR